VEKETATCDKRQKLKDISREKLIAPPGNVKKPKGKKKNPPRRGM